MTEDGYGLKFHLGKPEQGESPEQFINYLRNYLKKWMVLASTPDTAEAIKDLFVKEQFLNLCPKDLASHLRELRVDGFARDG